MTATVLFAWFLATLLPPFLTRRRGAAWPFCVITWLIAVLTWPLALVLSLILPRDAKTPPRAEARRRDSASARS